MPRYGVIVCTLSILTLDILKVDPKTKSELQPLNKLDNRKENKTDYQDSFLIGRGVASQLFIWTSEPMNFTSQSLVPSPISTISASSISSSLTSNIGCGSCDLGDLVVRALMKDLYMSGIGLVSDHTSLFCFLSFILSSTRGLYPKPKVPRFFGGLTGSALPCKKIPKTLPCSNPCFRISFTIIMDAMVMMGVFDVLNFFNVLSASEGIVFVKSTTFSKFSMLIPTLRIGLFGTATSLRSFIISTIFINLDRRTILMSVGIRAWNSKSLFKGVAMITRNFGWMILVGFGYHYWLLDIIIQLSWHKEWITHHRVSNGLVLRNCAHCIHIYTSNMEDLLFHPVLSRHFSPL
ncbi:hypothetical protein RDI58_017682 [Solanum bulbocastanum]|uniref:Uncharacterized protein n=1 Tax=Solanum bulbocastanum TaxID=147425 RepID=A0AAN8YC86_SOLBU